MAAALPQLAAQDDRRADLLVAGAHVLAAPVVDHGVPQAHALGVEEREARPLVVEAEQVQVAADAAVVAAAGQLELLQVRRQLLLLREGCAVDAGEHGVLLVAPPVGAGQAGELEGAGAQPGRAGQMGAAAQVRELALGVDADGRLRPPFGGGSGHQILHELDLEGLVERQGQTGVRLAVLSSPEHGQRLVDRHHVAGRRQVLAHDLRHLLLDAGEVGLGDGLGEVEVVVEAVLDGRADGVPRARPQPQHGLRQHVRRGVTQHVQPLGVGGGDDGDRVALLQRRGRVHEAGSVVAAGGGHAARDGGLGQPWPDRRRGVGHGGAVVEFKG